MNEEIMKKYSRYSEITTLMKALDDEKKELAKEILGEFAASDISKLKTPFGSFSSSSRNTWKYTSEVLELEARLKEMKKYEEKNGIAVPVAGALSIRCTPTQD